MMDSTRRRKGIDGQQGIGRERGDSNEDWSAALEKEKELLGKVGAFLKKEATVLTM